MRYIKVLEVKTMKLQNRWQIVIHVVIFLFLLIGCSSTYTKSGTGDEGLNRAISIKVTSGNVFMSLLGYASENIHSYSAAKNQDFILYETQNFEYALTDAEVLMVNVRSVDDNDAELMVTEHGERKEYKIDGKNKDGQIITFKN